MTHYKKCSECGSFVKGACDCGDLDQNLKDLLKECREFSFKDKTFKENKQSISYAFHIPYSGFGDPDYVRFWDYFEDSIYSVILECFENSDVKTLEGLKEAFEKYDDNGSIHNHVEGTLTWQQGLRESAIIFSELSEYETTDTGLWEGLQPEEAITSKAFWTYKDALQSEGLKKIGEFENGEE